MTSLLFAAGIAGAADHHVAGQSDFDRLNSINFEPGDRVFLASGATFTGTLQLGSSDTGTDAAGELIAPILITTSGSGRATIAAGDGSAINAYNNGGIEIRNLTLLGSGVAVDGTTTNTKSGISFYNDAPGDLKFHHLRIDNVEASGFGSCGISIGGYNGSAGYDDVRITNAHVHGNLHAGIQTYGETGVTNALTNVTVAHCEASHQTGRAGSAGNRGSGIVLGGVTGGVIEHCLAHHNGANSTTSDGPVGIWAYHSSNIILQHNESHSNRTQGGDGGGFDLDIGTTGSVMQYNYSHDNDGAGFLIYGTADSNASTGHVVRYNVSQNDGRNSSSGAASGINLSNNVSDLAVYGNTVLLSAPSGNTGIPAIKSAAYTHNPDRIVVANNIFVTTGGTRLVNLHTTGRVTFAGNNYWSSGGSFVVRDGGTNYSSLSSWRSAKGQERLNGQATGRSVDPLFQEPASSAKALTGSTLSGRIAFKLQASSPLIDSGLNLMAGFGIDAGPNDFFGAQVAQGGGHEIGAHEFAVNAPVLTEFHFAPESGVATLRYRSEIGTAFLVRRSADLRTWTDLSATAIGDGSVMEYLDTPPAGGKHFYVLVRE